MGLCDNFFEGVCRPGCGASIGPLGAPPRAESRGARKSRRLRIENESVPVLPKPLLSPAGRKNRLGRCEIRLCHGAVGWTGSSNSPSEPHTNRTPRDNHGTGTEFQPMAGFGPTFALVEPETASWSSRSRPCGMRLLMFSLEPFVPHMRESAARATRLMRPLPLNLCSALKKGLRASFPTRQDL